MELIEAVGQFDSAITATLAGLVVGVVMKLTSKIADRRKDSLIEHFELRKELREELDTVKEELRILQREVNEWREKYYQQVELTAILQAELSQLRIEVAEYKNTTGEFNV